MTEEKRELLRIARNRLDAATGWLLPVTVWLDGGPAHTTAALDAALVALREAERLLGRDIVGVVPPPPPAHR